MSLEARIEQLERALLEVAGEVRELRLLVTPLEGYKLGVLDGLEVADGSAASIESKRTTNPGGEDGL